MPISLPGSLRKIPEWIHPQGHRPARNLIGVSTLLAAVLALSVRPSPAPETKPAFGFRGDPRHTGVYETTGPRRTPVLRWRLETGGPIRSSPLVVGSTVYFGSGDRYLRAVDTASGEERWRFRTSGGVASSPAFADGLVLASCRDGWLYAVGADTGQLRWRTRLGEEVPFHWGYDYFLSSPLVVGDHVFVGGGDGCLHALALPDGRAVWQFRTGGRVRSSPAYADGVLFVGSMDGRLYAVSAATGQQVWKFDTLGAGLDSAKFGYDRNSVISSPAVSGDAVVIGGRDGLIYAVDRKTGKERWRFDHQPSWVMSSPAIYNGLVLTGTSDRMFFQAVNLGDGTKKWRFDTKSNVFSSGTVAGGAVYFGAFDGNVFALDATTGAELWRFGTGGKIFATPAVADGTLYVGSDDGGLYALACPATETKIRGPARRVVYWDPKPRWKYFQGDKQVRDFLAERGYETIGPEALGGVLKDRARDQTPSVIVFASDGLPSSLNADDGSALFRDYLAGGGKMVWLGAPPFFFDLDPVTGQPRALSPRRTEKLLGVRHTEVFQDPFGTRVTSDGFRWGLRQWTLSSFAVDPGQVTTVLATDELSRAAAWVKNFGHPAPESGFVRLWGCSEPYPDLFELKRIAEFGLK